MRLARLMVVLAVLGAAVMLLTGCQNTVCTPTDTYGFRERGGTRYSSSYLERVRAYECNDGATHWFKAEVQ